jgi:hypothetical protein
MSRTVHTDVQRTAIVVASAEVAATRSPDAEGGVGEVRAAQDEQVVVPFRPG